MGISANYNIVFLNGTGRAPAIGDEPLQQAGVCQECRQGWPEDQPGEHAVRRLPSIEGSFFNTQILIWLRPQPDL